MSKWSKALPAVLLAAALVAGAALVLYILKLAGPGSTAKSLSTPVFIRQIQSLSQLVTVRYVMEKVVILEDVKWYGENRVLLVAHGNIKAGVDLAQLKPDDVEIRGTTARIRLPPAVITDVYLDENQTRVIERNTGLLRTFDKDMEQNARQVAVDDMRRAARNAGILQEANTRARQLLSEWLHLSGCQTIEFR
ncbi:MAG TPA: DUF4230 domain-containing protein [Candidatus Paceibacterota bacterium]|nr:DUF4230 domain-containing protein [Verrucomicrobiota bacterium]HRY47923.1 DUF4230 domain-containing protein [Candidatus Paceibacterota bacterium]HSA00336.1 DUF4230 domain-containing protein [Candidatus Paceibacterota bacterium]